MQFRNLFVVLFGTKAKAAVLQTLVRTPAQPWTGRELAKGAGVSAPQAAQALRDFERQGLVERRMAGRSSQWRLNREHVVVGLLQPLADFPDRQSEMLLAEIRAAMDLRPLKNIRLFGSMARKTESASSDVDLLFIVRKPQDVEKITEKSKEVEIRLAERFGNIGSILVYDQKTSDSKRTLELAKNIEREGITLYEARRHG